jgi:chemotaxis protein MotB
MEPEEDDGPPGVPAWVVTFADLMSLLLTFFILLLSFSSTQTAKFEAIAGAMKNALGLRSELDLSDRPDRREMIASLENQRAQKDQPIPGGLEKELQALLAQLGGSDRATVALNSDGIVLNISGDLMFASGSAVLSPEAVHVLDSIANYVLQSSRPVDVIGHTDNVPIATTNFPSNWELSAARAGSAVRYLAERGVDPDRLRAIGRANTRPLAPNTSAEERSLNRRVEFIFNLQKELPEEPSSDESRSSREEL